MSKNDALIYAPDKIRVNSIHPGFIWTPMVEGFVGQENLGEGRRELDRKNRVRVAGNHRQAFDLIL